MSNASPRDASRLTAWKWTAFLLGTLWVSIGCNPGTIGMFLMPFSNDRIAPKCPLAGKKEVTVCLVTNFAGLDTRPDTLPASTELAELFAQQLRKRAQESKEKIKVVPPDQVRSYQNRADSAGRSPTDIGKHFNADYVVALEIGSLSLYEKKSLQQLLRGTTDITIQVFDLRKPAAEATILTEPYRREYPSNAPVDVGDMNAMQFRVRFLNAVATDLARMFTPYHKDERFDMD